MPHLVQAGLNAGFVAYLTQPFEVEQLIEQLQRVFGKAALADQ